MKNNTVDAATKPIMQYPKCMCIRVIRLNGMMDASVLFSDALVSVYRHIVNGRRAIWSKIACIAPNSSGGTSLFHQYKFAPFGTMASTARNLM
eukprot:31287-Pelagococcus_subviridis.AAC.8